MTLGQKIREARIERGMTQKQLVGKYITRNMLSKIENDSATPSMRTLEYLAERLGLSPGYLIGDTPYSNGTSPDGLDEMRLAYKEGRFAECLRLLESSKTAATTDEGYLLRAKASLAAANEAMADGNYRLAKELADDADYYNKEGIYYSAETDAEMSLVLAECALALDISEFEYNASEYERAVKSIRFDVRFILAKCEYFRRTGEQELAEKLLEEELHIPKEYEARYHLLLGLIKLDLNKVGDAEKELKNAEAFAKDGSKLCLAVYSALEQLYLSVEDYKSAHFYSSKRLSSLDK